MRAVGVKSDVEISEWAVAHDRSMVGPTMSEGSSP